MKAILSKLTTFETILASTLIALMTTLVIVDVLMREILHTGIPWAQKASVYMMIWSGFLGAALVSAKATHLRPEVGDKLWEKYPKVFVRVQNFICLAFCAFFFYASYSYVQESFEFGDKSVALQVPLWFLQLVIPYTFFSISLRHLYFLFNPNEQLSMKKEYS